MGLSPKQWRREAVHYNPKKQCDQLSEI